MLLTSILWLMLNDRMFDGRVTLTYAEIYTCKSMIFCVFSAPDASSSKLLL